MTTFYLVRHGQSLANAQHILQGALIDTPLSDNGKQQAQQTAAKLAKQRFEYVFSSPLQRAAQTAQIIAPTQTVTYDWRLSEFDYGQWDGQKIAELWQKYPQFYDAEHNLLDGSQKYSHGETHAQAKQRLLSFFEEVTTQLPENAQVLLVSHGYTIKLIVDLVLEINNLTSLNEPTNAGVTKINWSLHTRTLKYFNR